MVWCDERVVLPCTAVLSGGQHALASAAACQLGCHASNTHQPLHHAHVPRRPRALLDVAPEDLRKDVTAQEGEPQSEGKGGEDGAPARPLDQEPVSAGGGWWVGSWLQLCHRWRFRWFAGWF